MLAVRLCYATWLLVCVAAIPEYQILSLKNGQQFPIPELTVQGNHYGIGLAIGKTFQKRIQNFFTMYAYLYQELVPFVNTTSGQQIFQEFLAKNEKEYPQYFEELRGLSAGSGVSLQLIQLLNFEDEIGALNSLAKRAEYEESCTDVHLSDKQRSVHVYGHNEDNDATVCRNAFIVHATIFSNASWAARMLMTAAQKQQQQQQQDSSVRDLDGAVSKWTAYMYPGYVSGVAFGFNSHGLTFSENALFPSYVNIGGLGDNFLARKAYDAKTIAEVISILSHPDRAYGFSFNVGALAQKHIVNIEFDYHKFSVKEIAGNYSHENMYRHLNVDAYVDLSSQARLARIDALPPVRSSVDILNVLGDTKDPNYPIYRNGAAPDCCNTCATVIFDLDKRTADVYDSNPALAVTPYFSYSLL